MLQYFLTFTVNQNFRHFETNRHGFYMSLSFGRVSWVKRRASWTKSRASFVKIVRQKML
jgi:hypothetical protein